MNKNLIWIVGLVVVLIALMAAVRTASGPSNTTDGDLKTPVTEEDHARGSGETVLVEYSDFQCPACATYEPAIQQLLADLDGQVRLVYRHFPLRQTHPNANLAAQAAEAAALQDMFWEMHDLIFENQLDWANGSGAGEMFISYAEELGLDIAQFEEDMRSDEVKQKVQEDFESGMRSGVNSTPSFFLNGKKIQNPRNYQEFKSTVENAINNS